MFLQLRPFLHTDMTQVVEIISQVRVNIMGADVLAMQGVRASATMVLTKLNRNNLVLTHLG